MQSIYDEHCRGKYADATFALGGFTIANGINTFTAIGWDYVGNTSTNSVTVNLPGTNNYSYDFNGNLLSDVELPKSCCASLAR